MKIDLSVTCVHNTKMLMSKNWYLSIFSYRCKLTRAVIKYQNNEELQKFF